MLYMQLHAMGCSTRSRRGASGRQPERRSRSAVRLSSQLNVAAVWPCAVLSQAPGGLGDDPRRPLGERARTPLKKPRMPFRIAPKMPFFPGGAAPTGSLLIDSAERLRSCRKGTGKSLAGAEPPVLAYASPRAMAAAAAMSLGGEEQEVESVIGGGVGLGGVLGIDDPAAATPAAATPTVCAFTATSGCLATALPLPAAATPAAVGTPEAAGAAPASSSASGTMVACASSSHWLCPSRVASGEGTQGALRM